MRKPIALTITSASPNPTGSMSCREVEEIEGFSYLRDRPSSSSIDRVHSSDVGHQRRISAWSECFVAAPKPLGAVRTRRIFSSEHGLSVTPGMGFTPCDSEGRRSREHQHRCSVRSFFVQQVWHHYPRGPEAKTYNNGSKRGTSRRRDKRTRGVVYLKACKMSTHFIDLDTEEAYNAEKVTLPIA